MKAETGRQEMRQEKTRKGTEIKREREVEVRANGLTINLMKVLVIARRGNLLLTITSGEKLKMKREEKGKAAETIIEVKGKGEAEKTVDTEKIQGRTIDTEKMVDTVLEQKSSEMITLIEEKTLPMGEITLPMGKNTLPMGEMRDSGKSAIA